MSTVELKRVKMKRETQALKKNDMPVLKQKLFEVDTIERPDGKGTLPPLKGSMSMETLKEFNVKRLMIGSPLRTQFPLSPQNGPN